MDILALDLSLTATGVCTPAGETFVIETKKLRGAERLNFILEHIADLLSSHKIDIVIIEGYSFGSQGRAVFQIGELGGVIRLALYQEGIPCVEVPPSCLKKYICGKGNASKDDVLQQAVVRSGHTFKDNNCADSWVLHQLGLAHYDPENPLLVAMPALNRTALDGVEWI
jgi:Holliday junction resolvasome RuvABC endonuclease subunit